MAEYEITAANGAVFQVQAQDDAQAQRIESWINQRVAAGDPDLKGAPVPDNGRVVRPEAEQPSVSPNTIVDALSGKDRPRTSADTAGLKDAIVHGMSLGGDDEVVGLGSALGNMVLSPFSSDIDFDPIGAYSRGKANQSAAISDYQRRHPYGATGGELLGGLLTLRPGAGSSSLLQTVKSGAKEGAKYGAIAGGLNAEGANRVTGAAIGGTAGALFGSTLPVGFRLVQRPVQAAIDFLSPRAGVGQQIVQRAMSEDGLTPQVAGNALDQARQNGVPLSLADLGDNLRGLTGSLSRKPGKARSLVTSAMKERQAGQTDRIRGALTRDLGPIGHVPTMADNLTAAAQTRAGPLYREAYAVGGVDDEVINGLLQHPEMRAAFERAQQLHADDAFLARTLGNPEPPPLTKVYRERNPAPPTGDPELDKLLAASPTMNPDAFDLVEIPDVRTLDYIKRGLDRMIDSAYSGDAQAKMRAPFLKDLRSNLLARLDTSVPEYQAARAAYADPVKQREALEAGRTAASASADDIGYMTEGMSQPQLAQFALGHRSALAEALDRRITSGNNVSTLVGSPRKQAALAKVYGASANLNRLGNTLENEQAAYDTFKTVALGSPTANRLADDAITGDQPLLEDLAGRALKGARGGFTGVLAEGINAVRDLGTFGAGKAGQRAREDAAALLLESDPAELAKAYREAMRVNAKRRLSDRTSGKALVGAGGLFGRGAGMLGGYLTQQPQ